MLKKLKSFALLTLFLGFMFSASLVSCKQAQSDDKESTEHPSGDEAKDSSEHPSGSQEHPNDSKADSTKTEETPK